MRITEHAIEKYLQYLAGKERSRATLKKYRGDLMKLLRHTQDQDLEKELVLSFKESLLPHYKGTSINSMLAAVNGFLEYINYPECRVSLIRIQRQLFVSSERELTKSDYRKLVKTARSEGKERLSLILQTICATGIRVSELSGITAEGVANGKIQVFCKNKQRIIFVPAALQAKLSVYIREQHIHSGPVFLTRTGRAVSRITIWKEMKNLAVIAGVEPEKVYPHNLRHLFARTFYQQEKDIIRLSDILGHSNLATTRIYTISNGDEHERKIETLGLVV